MEQQRADALHSHETTHTRNHVCVCVRARVCMHGSKAVLVPACTLTDQVILGIHHVTEQLTLRASWELRLESESFTGQHGSRKTGLLAP